MKNKLFGLLLIAAFAITNGALAQRPATEPGVMGKIKEMFVGPSKPRDARMADMRSPKLSGTERWNQVIRCLEKSHSQDEWIMKWAHKNLRRAEHWSGLSPAQRKTVHRKKRMAKEAIMGEAHKMRAPHKAHKRKKTRAERVAASRTHKRKTAAERAAEAPRRSPRR